jgi:hypothetical protein
LWNRGAPAALCYAKVTARWLFTLARLLITVFYSAALGGSLMWAMEDRGLRFPFAAVSLTVAYGILIALLWLYERYPTPPVARGRSRQRCRLLTGY